MSDAQRQWIGRACQELEAATRRFAESNSEELLRLAEACSDCLRRGGRLLLFGNGGSAAQAQHLAAEFVNRLRDDRAALSAIALTTDSAVLTSIANDSGFRQVFARQIEGLAREGDIAIAFSTSGRSENVKEGLLAARRIGAFPAAFLGPRERMDDELLDLTRIALCVPADETTRIQELHLLAGHLLCGLVEQALR